MNPFYNPTQRRLRAFWRLLLQTLIFLVGTLLGSIVIIPIILLSLTNQGLLTPGVMADPNALSQLIQAEMTNLPYLGLINGSLSLLFMLLSYWLAARFFDRRPFRDFGFHFSRAWWRDFGFGLALGALLMAFIFGVELAAGWITIAGVWQAPAKGPLPLAGILLIGVVDFIFVGIYEEMLSRGYQLRNLAEGFNWRFLGPTGALLLAYLLSSLVFGALHQGNPNAGPFTTPNLALAGLFLGLGYVLTGELAIPIGLHITWNFFQGYVFGLPVSGMATRASLITTVQSGPGLWTGGAWGPEGGMVGLLTLLLGGLLIVAWVRMTRGQVRLQDRLAVYQPPQVSGDPGLAGTGSGQPAAAEG